MSSVEILLRAACAVLIYPGFLFLAGVGLLAESLRRQFAARAEGKTSPPLGQPLFDLLKLLRLPANVPNGLEPAEDVVGGQELADSRREGSRFALYAIPVLGLLTVVSAAVMLPVPGNLWPFLTNANNGTVQPLGGDLLAVGVLALVPAIGAVIVGSVGGSVYGQLASARIFQLLVVCAVPYGATVFGPALASSTLAIQKISSTNTLPVVGLKSLCGLLFLLTIPAILRLRPFAASHSETLEGVTTDLSGAALGLFWLMEWAEKILYSAIFTVLFIPFADNPVACIAGFVLGLGVIGLVDSLFSQVRSRDALNFYLRYANPAALVIFMLVTFAVKV